MILGDSTEDGVGIGDPDEGFGVGGAFVEVREGLVFQRIDGREHAATQLLLCQVGEDSLHLIEPTRARRREVQAVASMTFEPTLDRRGLVRGVGGEDDVNACIDAGDGTARSPPTS